MVLYKVVVRGLVIIFFSFWVFERVGWRGLRSYFWERVELVERMDGRGGMFLLGYGNVCFFFLRIGCGYVNYFGGKLEGFRTYLLVFIKNKKER